MARSMRFKTFVGAVLGGWEDGVKGKTTVKVVTTHGEEQVRSCFHDEGTGEFVLVTEAAAVDDPDGILIGHGAGA